MRAEYAHTECKLCSICGFQIGPKHTAKSCVWRLLLARQPTLNQGAWANSVGTPGTFYMYWINTANFHQSDGRFIRFLQDGLTPGMPECVFCMWYGSFSSLLPTRILR
jgi:hypothetical protein